MDHSTEDFSFIVPDWKYYASIHACVESDEREVDIFAVIYEDVDLRCWQKTFVAESDDRYEVASFTSHMRWEPDTPLLGILADFIVLMKERGVRVHRVEYIFNESGSGLDLYNEIIREGYLQFDIF